MDLIYIHDYDDSETGAAGYRPNFTIPGHPEFSHSNELKTKGLDHVKAKPLVSASLLPLGVVTGIGITLPFLAAQILGSDKPATNILDQIEMGAIDAFIRRHGVSVERADQLGYRFPPGHPKTGQIYRLHPLAKLSDSGKGGVYIPEEGYDELLLDEREAELIRLLVELGATRIAISEKLDRNANAALSASANAGVKGLGEGKVEGGTKSNSTELNHESREFKLKGKPWQRGEKIDRSNFAWVAFEPSWGAMVTAREVGECTKAALEIREETTFSSEKHLSAALKVKLYGGGASGKTTAAGKTSKTYLIDAEFAPFVERER